MEGHNYSLKKEMANFVAFYMDVTIPQLERMIVELQDKLARKYDITICLTSSYMEHQQLA